VKHQLTRQDYDRIRALLDARARARFAVDPAKCKGCDGHVDNFTIGCKTCGDRLRHRARREDPVLREHDRRIWREARRRRRAAA
jgi:hypothetical protein